MDNKTTERTNVLEETYNARCLEKSDINEHLPVLRIYASMVDHVTEFGIRQGNSTVALACGRPKKMVSYDIHAMPEGLNELISSHVQFSFVQADVLQVEIEPTELLFIDTHHTYNQLKLELELHADKVSKYIILHDTDTFGHISEDGSEPGLIQAIKDFLTMHPEWIVKKTFSNNNGLTICQRKDLS